MKKITVFLVALILLFLMAFPCSAASYAVSEPAWVNIDGVISTEEWGVPLYEQVTLVQAQTKAIDDALQCRWYDTTTDSDVRLDLYLTHNDTTLYVGCVVTGVNAEISTTEQPWQQMNFTFTLSDYQADTGVRHVMEKGKEYEAYTGYRIYQTADGQTHAQTITQGLKPRDLREGRDYVAVYDAASRTMTYEVAVPLSYTSLSLTKNPDMAFSAVIALEQYNNGVTGRTNGSNRFLIGTGAADGGGAGNWAHRNGCIRVRLMNADQIGPPPQASADHTQHPQIPIVSEPEYKIITADAPVSVPVIIILASVIAALICAALVTLTLVRERNEQVRQAGKDEEI